MGVEKTIALNRKARHEYHIDETFEAGLVLTGTEIKAVRANKVNLANAKSVFRFDCLNNECVRGDFDLSEDLANAIAAHRTSAVGEMCCQGWRSKTTIGTVQCHNILRYTLSLGY